MKHLQFGALAMAMATMLFTANTQAAQAAPAVKSTGAAAAQTVQFQDLSITVRGSGQPVLMIPGVNSAASVWDETCERLQPGVQCLMVQLPGFAGKPAAPAMAGKYLEASKAQLKEFLKAQAPQGAVVVGHSLGGALGLMLAADTDNSVQSLVVVDSLPFLAAAQNPNATIETVRPMAEGMRSGMSQPAPAERKRAMLAPMAATMTLDSRRAETIVQWGVDSDNPSTGQAMFELWTTDLRPLLQRIKAPTTVLGAWAAYARMGSTLQSTQALFENQYRGLSDMKLKMSERGYHFLMWDDPALVLESVQQALSGKATR